MNNKQSFQIFFQTILLCYFAFVVFFLRFNGFWVVFCRYFGYFKAKNAFQPLFNFIISLLPQFFMRNFFIFIYFFSLLIGTVCVTATNRRSLIFYLMDAAYLKYGIDFHTQALLLIWL